MKPYRGSIWKNLTMSFHINPDLVPAVAPLHSWKWFIFFISLNNNRFVSIWIRVWLIILKVARGLNKVTRRTLHLLPLCPWYGSTFQNFLWQSPRIYDLQISPQCKELQLTHLCFAYSNYMRLQTCKCSCRQAVSCSLSLVRGIVTMSVRAILIEKNFINMTKAVLDLFDSTIDIIYK